MKTTNGNAFGILLALAACANETGRLGYAIAKQRRIIETELTEFINLRNAAIRRHCAEDGQLSEAAAAEANREIREYLDIPCEFAVVSVPADVFIGGTLTADQMYLLDFMVEV